MLSVATNPAYRRACVLFSLLSWIPALMVRPLIHGGGIFDGAIAEASIVVGGYCTLELARSSPVRWNRIVWGIWCIPYVILVGVFFYYAIPYVPRLFTI